MEVSQQDVVHRFEFRGKASEYFRIWIVNVLLSLLTFGIYSAWAKVRARRYFYGNTFLNGSSFDYHANPIAILKGRIIFGIFALFYMGSEYYPPLAAVLALFVLAFPYLLVRGMIFNMTNTSYRGVRFGFAKDYKGSYITYIKATLLWVLSLTILAGMAIFQHEKFRVTRSRFGKTEFTFSGDMREYWFIYLRALGMGLLGAIILALSILLAGGMGTVLGKLIAGILGLVLLVMFYAYLAFVFTYVRAKSLNYVFRHTRLDQVRIRSRYDAWDLYLIYVANFFVCALTLGLAYPWARIELAKYRASTTEVIAPIEAFDKFAQAQLEAGGAVGDQTLEFWDIDIGF